MQRPNLILTNNLKLLNELRNQHKDIPLYFVTDVKQLETIFTKQQFHLILIDSTEFNDTVKNILETKKDAYDSFELFTDIKAVKTFISRLSPQKAEKHNLTELTPPKKSESFEKIAGFSDEIKYIKNKIIKSAVTNLPVLITGETGTGKTLAANAIHELSDRSSNEILEVNLNEVSENLFESILFGHITGAFTGADSNHKGFFETADSTTLFLDEIGDLSLQLQAKLLRVIDKKEFFPVGANRAKKTSARLIFATNADLEAKVREGLFRKDLYRRLKNLTIELIPLRKRREDIPCIVEMYMKKHGMGKKITKETMNILKAHDWAGNIGELQNCLNRTIVFTDEEEITPESIEF